MRKRVSREMYPCEAQQKSSVSADCIVRNGHGVGISLRRLHSEERVAVPGTVDVVHRLAPNVKNPNTPREIIVKSCRRIDMEDMRHKAIKKRRFSASNLGLASECTLYVNLAMSRVTRIQWAAVRRFREENL
ncbi:hypothetical protein J6590_024368 [Homalodisca vitripennis]|nr:hypothetical protein J6590_024368 [Homalodisca vitripennis]